MNFFEKQKTLCAKAADLRLRPQMYEDQKNYQDFCQANMAKVCELLERALKEMRMCTDDYGYHQVSRRHAFNLEEIQSELEKLK